MNINKPCASCSKVVYPLEQIKFLDLVWHKACFRCETCKTTLNTRTCKGYERKVYCNVHYPKPSYTFVADTPEIQRVATNTKVVSNVKYHEDYEKSKGTKISVSNDPVLDQQKQNTEYSSQLTYSGAQEKKISMEALRPKSGSQENRGSTGGAHILVENSRNSSRPGSIYDYEPGNGTANVVGHKSGSSTTFFARPKSQDLDNETISNQKERNSTSNGDAKIDSPPANDKKAILRAVYNYTAQDDDEASFFEGDVILDSEVIDEGWMYGTVQRTGEYAMLPRNYFEPVEG